MLEWHTIAAAASVEKDPVKLRALVDTLIEALRQEQKRAEEEIAARLKLYLMEKTGLEL
jgi:hypothetical protein